MKYAIVYSSKTGNTKCLAEKIQSVLGSQDCIYFGEPSARALEADRIYVGFWTDKGNCDSQIAEFLKSVSNQQVFLFGTAGFGGTPSYFESILNRARDYLPNEAKLVGTFMCQGKMPMSVRARYEKMMESPEHAPNLPMMIENFDRALSHPDQEDLAALEQAVKK